MAVAEAPGAVVMPGAQSRLRRARADRYRNPGKRRRMMRELIERDGLTCWLCGEPVDPDLPRDDAWAGTFDHVVAHGDGGPFELHNLRLAHCVCNRRRDGQNV